MQNNNQERERSPQKLATKTQQQQQQINKQRLQKPKKCVSENNGRICKNPQCTQIHSNPKSVAYDRDTIPYHLQKGWHQNKEEFEKQVIKYNLINKIELEDDSKLLLNFVVLENQNSQRVLYLFDNQLVLKDYDQKGEILKKDEKLSISEIKLDYKISKWFIQENLIIGIAQDESQQVIILDISQIKSQNGLESQNIVKIDLQSLDIVFANPSLLDQQEITDLAHYTQNLYIVGLQRQINKYCLQHQLSEIQIQSQKNEESGNQEYFAQAKGRGYVCEKKIEKIQSGKINEQLRVYFLEGLEEGLQNFKILEIQQTL
ncbi:hypothetical protein PPERSA_11667 [Pseudocohnilembus persalinus]|uniref:Uncharacterized protein n=1 Tax=Pseudocohnilembus persalinus TaxID=266149 RepID=A0A0V0QA91_PSEPJ|nr:hypothetical protein PPERSA_11667 [Pseudocohnilembus persalinus]|eukprot:KRW99066.1 hypothetical protein PPERSA_11667 [Pseudocohnilembus persalinus]